MKDIAELNTLLQEEEEKQTILGRILTALKMSNGVGKGLKKKRKRGRLARRRKRERDDKA